jgi:hypothetical protein
MTATPSKFLGGQSATVNCKCGKPVVLSGMLVHFGQRYGVSCDACADAENERVKREAEARCRIIDASGWEKICPPEFQHTEPHKLPSPTKLQKVLEWQYGLKGLILYGNTGAGKSRCLYLLLKREYKAGRTIRVLSHDSGYRYAERFNESPAEVHRWIEDRVKAHILALDDTFKCKLTESFEQALFTIVSQRTERGLPILATLQDVGASLTERMSADRGAALVRRLREYCATINFSK